MATTKVAARPSTSTSPTPPCSCTASTTAAASSSSADARARIGATVSVRCPAMDDGWTIDIDAAGDPADADEHFDDRIAEFERALEPWGGAAAASDERDHFGARFS